MREKFKFKDVSHKFGGQKTWYMCRQRDDLIVSKIYPVDTGGYEAEFKNVTLSFKDRREIVLLLREIRETPPHVILNLVSYE